MDENSRHKENNESHLFMLACQMNYEHNRSQMVGEDGNDCLLKRQLDGPSGFTIYLITVGSLNTDILRYNADNLSITLKLWGKLDENVSWVNTFPPHSSISLHFIRQNIAHRVTTVPMLATAPILSTRKVLSRGNGCHKRATTLILWGLRQVWGNFRFRPG